MKHFPALSSIAARHSARRVYTLSTGAVVTALAVVAAGCGGSSTSPSATQATPTGHKGGTFTILANSAFGVADPAQNYMLEEW